MRKRNDREQAQGTGGCSLAKPTLSLLLVLEFGASLLTACRSPNGSRANDTPQVIASFYPMQYLTDRIAGGRLTVGVLVPQGAQPHDYDLKPGDAAALSRTKLIVLQGAGFEPFLEKVMQNAQQADIPVVIASEGIALRASHGEEGMDPHTWLDPVAAAVEARNIERALEKVDPPNARAYERNLASLLSDLRGVDAAYRGALAHCAKRKIVTTHAAFGYLGAEYDFTQFAIGGIAPDAEPSAVKIKEMVDLATQEKITTIFFETLMSPQVASVVAEEVHAKTQVLDPIEGLTAEGAARGETYLSLLLQNLDHLREAMECH
jgi:zinc transport system substrate-binding protein